MTGSFPAAPIQCWPAGSRSWRRSWCRPGVSQGYIGAARKWEAPPTNTACRYGVKGRGRMNDGGEVARWVSDLAEGGCGEFRAGKE